MDDGDWSALLVLLAYCTGFGHYALLDYFHNRNLRKLYEHYRM
jgi:hypothetical protein